MGEGESERGGSPRPEQGKALQGPLRASQVDMAGFQGARPLKRLALRKTPCNLPTLALSLGGVVACGCLSLWVLAATRRPWR